MNAEELNRLTGASPTQLEAWRAVGLLGVEGSADFGLETVELVRLIQFCLRRGFDARAIATAERLEPGFLRNYLAQLFPAGVAPTHDLTEAARLAELDLSLVQRLWETIATGDTATRLDRADVEMLRSWKVALEAGLPEEALLELVRVYVDSLGRLSEAEARLFHFYVHEPLHHGGLSGLALREATEAAAQPMRQLIEPALLYYHRKGMANALREDLAMHLAEYVAPAERSETPAQLRLAIAFLDLSSFTPLTEIMGDAVAAEVVERFSELVRDVVNRHHGRIVDRIGDAFMLAFPDPASAIACALEVDQHATSEARFPAVRGGVHFGPVLYREGGYVGSNVNIASRVANEARRHQILLTAAVRSEIGDLPGVDFVSLGGRALKGLAEDLELFEARVKVVRPAEKLIDPVCGIELSRAAVAVTLVLGGSERVFCCERCFRRFAETPERYQA